MKFERVCSSRFNIYSIVLFDYVEYSIVDKEVDTSSII